MFKEPKMWQTTLFSDCFRNPKIVLEQSTIRFCYVDDHFIVNESFFGLYETPAADFEQLFSILQDIWIYFWLFWKRSHFTIHNASRIHCPQPQLRELCYHHNLTTGFRILFFLPPWTKLLQTIVLIYLNLSSSIIILFSYIGTQHKKSAKEVHRADSKYKRNLRFKRLEADIKERIYLRIRVTKENFNIMASLRSKLHDQEAFLTLESWQSQSL